MKIEGDKQLEDPKVPVVRIAIQNQVGTKKIINFETWVDVLTSKEAMNALVDKLMDVSDRQSKKYELIDLQGYEKQQTIEFEAMAEDLKQHEEKLHQPRFVDGRRNPIGPAKETEVAVANLKVTLETKRKFIKKLRNDIKEREQELSG